MPETAAKDKSAPGFERNPDYDLRIERAGHRVRATIADTIVADSENALLMYEGELSPTYYFPRGDVDLEHFQRTEANTYCSYKGEAVYWSITAEGSDAENAVWSYETPYKQSAEIEGYIAFYPSKVRVRADN